MIDLNVITYNEGELELNISLNKDTIWLSQLHIAKIFDTSSDNIGLHFKNIYKEKELDINSTTEDFSVVRKEGNRSVKRNIKHYNLDAIISVGYRVNSKKATKFRQWATKVLKQYIEDGYAINTHKLTEKRLDLVESDIKTIKSHINENSLDLKQGIYFDGEIFDAYAFVSDLIKQAKKSIVLIDNYIDESVLILFSKTSKIKISIYTTNITKQLKLDIQKYNKQYGNLEINEAKNFHDRFLIVDEVVYHFGASLKDLAKKSFAFSKFTAINKEDILSKVKGR